MFDIRPVPADPTPAELDSLVTLRHALDEEANPGDAPVPRERVLLDLTAAVPLMAIRTLAAWDGDVAVGLASMWRWYGQRNRELGEFDLFVHPGHRRRGAGTALVHAVAAELLADDRSRSVAFTYLNEASESFWQHLGCDLEYREQASRLDLASVDERLMARWIERRLENAADLSIVRWKGAVPDRLLATFRVARDAMNDAPLGTLEWEKGLDDETEIQAMSDWHLGLKKPQWTLAAVTPDGEIAGYTRVNVDELAPYRSEQDDTGVLPAHRGRGIGRWVKAEMWRWLRHEAPEVTRLETGNATDNDAMLAINTEMGFQPGHLWGGWQPDLGLAAGCADQPSAGEPA